MIRLGVAIDTFDLGGFELGCLDLLRRLDRRHFAPRVYAFRPGSLVRDAEAMGIPVRVAHDKPRSDRTWSEADSRARERYRDDLARALDKDQISLLLVWGWVDGVIAGVRARVPAIVERVDGPSLAGRVRDKSACARVICESRAVRRVIRAQRGVLRVDVARLTVIPNGVDLERFDPERYDRSASRAALGFGDDDFVVGSVARVAPEKHLDLLVDAVALLRRQAPAARVQLVLAGPDDGAADAIVRRARARRIPGSVHLLGARLDVAEILSAFDVFALPSLYEGTPYALLEAMAMGLPVICTPVGAVPEIVDGNGYLVPPLDANASAVAMRELLEDRPLRSRLGRRSRQLAARHDVATMVGAYERLLTEVHRAAVEDGP